EPTETDQVSRTPKTGCTSHLLCPTSRHSSRPLVEWSIQFGPGRVTRTRRRGVLRAGADSARARPSAAIPSQPSQPGSPVSLKRTQRFATVGRMALPDGKGSDVDKPPLLSVAESTAQ